MHKIEHGNNKVYTDPGLPDAEEMPVLLMSITQPKLCCMLRGQCRDISEIKIVGVSHTSWA